MRETLPIRPLWQRDLPLTSTPLVRAGFEISRGKFGGFGRGTAGLIVREKGASTGAYVLTCAHVLGMPAIGDPAKIEIDNLVFSPSFKECCGIECNRPFGQVVAKTLPPSRDQEVQSFKLGGTEAFAVDASLVELVGDAFGYNRVTEIGTIVGVRDLVQEWALKSGAQSLELPPARQIPVRKYGATTKLSEGTILRLTRVPLEGRLAPLDTDPLVFEIETNPGQDPFTGEYELDMARYKSALEIESAPEVVEMFKNTKVTATLGGSAATPTLKVVGRTFSQPGDSGAPIVDANRNVVGILRSGTFMPIFMRGAREPIEIATGNSQGVFVVAALEKLGVTFLAGGQHTAGAPIVVPGMAIERGAPPMSHWDALDAARAAIEDSPAGARLSALGRRHFDEVRRLIHHRRRVTVTWHRFKGPAFLVAFLHAAQRTDAPTPAEIDGVRLIDAVRAMCGVLTAEGSLGLRVAIAEHEHELVALAERATSLGDVLAALAAARREDT